MLERTGEVIVIVDAVLGGLVNKVFEFDLLEL